MEKLVWQANAEQWLAHKLERATSSVHEDVLGNVVCSQWVPAIPAKAPRRFTYTYLPNLVIVATSRPKKVTQAVFTQFLMVFNHFFSGMVLGYTK
jgi:hypothetical protein